MSSEDSADGLQDAGLHQEITAQVVAYLTGKGVTERSRVSFVSDVTGLSLMQARRRLGPAGPTWTVEELAKLTQHYGETLVDLFARGGSGIGLDACKPCEIEIAGMWYAARAQIGNATGNRRRGELVAVQHDHRWRLLPAINVPQELTTYEVVEVKLLPKASQNILVAILDDDASLAESLSDALTEGGFSAVAFASEDQLIERFQQFDVFVIDFVLSAKKTASTVVEMIRGAKPKAPIIVLTGHAREAASSEIASLMRTCDVDVQEKPAQIEMLESLINRRLEGGR